MLDTYWIIGGYELRYGIIQDISRFYDMYPSLKYNGNSLCLGVEISTSLCYQIKVKAICLRLIK